jgi:UDP-glucose 4-epimerase
MKRILITGSKGFIGRNLCEKLSKEDYEIYEVNRGVLDLSNEEEVDKYFEKQGFFDAVIHCAVKGGSRLKPDDPDTLEKNTNMYFNLRKNRDMFGKLIHFGSGSEIYAKTDYAKSKREIAKSIKETKNFYNMRLYGLFGYGELETRFFASNISNYIERKPIVIHEDMYMDFFFMDDLVSLVDYYLFKLNPPKEVDCVYQTDLTKLSHLAQMINELSDHRVPVKVMHKSMFGDIKHYVGSGSTLEDLNINFLGLHYGIQDVYKKMKNAKDKLRN